jgi:hypothetical protein
MNNIPKIYSFLFGMMLVPLPTFLGGSYNVTFLPSIELLTVDERTSGSRINGTDALRPIDGGLIGTLKITSDLGLCLISVSNSNNFLSTIYAIGVEATSDAHSKSLAGFTTLPELCLDVGV